MPSVDNRVVRLEFDNAAFERKIDATLHSLGQLDQALKLEGATKGLSAVQDAAKGINLSSIAEGVDHIAHRFTALGAVAFSAIQTITQGALGMAKKIGGDILEPIIGGGKKRALNLEQARFLFQGIGMDVDKAMASARKAVLGTAFGLDEAAKAAAQFGASGVDAGDGMYKTLRGVAGVAAMTNTGFAEMADVFTQAAGQGKISGYTLERISMRGLNAAAALGKQMGKSEAEIRQMASDGKISFQEFSKAMDDAFGAHAQEANQTYTGALANMRAALARVGAAFFTPQLQQQRDLFNALTPAIDSVKEALMPLIDAFSFLTTLSTAKLVKSIKGIDFSNLKAAVPIITKGFVNIWVALDKIKNIAGKAFRDIFPPSATSALIKFSNMFLEFTKHLTISGKTAQEIGRIFKGVFSIFSIGWTILKETVKFILNLGRALSGLTGPGVLEFFAKIGDFFTDLQKGLVKGGGIKGFFEELTHLIQAPIQYLKDFKTAMANLFGGMDPKAGDAVSKSVGRISDRIEHLKGLLEKAKDIWRPFGNALSKVADALDTAWQAVERWFAELGSRMAAAMQKGDFSALFDAINTTLLGGIAALIAKWMHGGINVDLTGGVLSSLTGTFNQLTGVLKSMQMEIKAEAIKKIAEALAILTASVLVLSLIDSAALTKALTAMAVGFGQLMGAFALLNQMDAGIKSGATFDLVAGGMIAVASAMVIFGGALTILARISWGDLVKGFVATGAFIVLMIAASKGLSKAAPGLILGGIGLSAMGVGLTIIAGAMALMGHLDWMTMGKGLIGIAGALVVIALGMNMMPANLILTGAGLIAVAIALNILAGALKLLGGLSWGQMVKGFVAIAGGLIIIAVAMNLMPANLPLTAAGLLLVSVSLNILGEALKSMGAMSWGEIAKGLTAMAGSLIILAAAAYAMQTSILGAIAIGVMAVSLKILGEALHGFADLSWGELLHGLVGIAAALALLAIAGLALEPAIPAMLGLGAALLVLGAGFALIGVGAYGVAKALEAIAKSGKAAAAALVDILKSIGKSMGALGRGIAEGLIEMVMTFAKALPVLVKLLGTFLNYLVEELIKLIPNLAKAIGLLIEALVKLVYEHGPEIIALGLYLLEQLLIGVRDNIDQITTLVSEIIVNFINALSEHIQEIIDAGMNFIISFFTGIMNNINKIQQLAIQLVLQFLGGVVGQYQTIIQGGVNLIVKFIQGIGNAAGRLATAAANVVIAFVTTMGNNAYRIVAAGTTAILKLIQGMSNAANLIVVAGGNAIIRFITGMASKSTEIVTAGTTAVLKFLQGVGQNAVRLARGAMQIMIDFLNGLSTAIDEKSGELRDAGIRVVGAIINGMTGGLASKAGDVANSAVDVAKGAMHKAKSFLKVVGDPYSVVFMGIGESMANGMSMALNADTTVEDSAVGMVGRATDVFKNSLGQITSVLGETTEFNPTITPVLDLTQVAADASKISDYISATPVASVSLANANVIAADTNAAKSPDSTTATDVATGGVKFEQNIYAPEQLSTADIYKQTRNQITMAKEELRIP